MNLNQEILEALEELRSRFNRLERRITFEELLRVVNEKRKKFRANMTQIKYDALTKRPDKDECKHRKGGSVCGPHVDYAVTTHTYPDGRKEIKCMICGDKWGPGDPGWEHATQMAYASTNTPTGSEVIFYPNLKDGKVTDEIVYGGFIPNKADKE